MVIRDSITRDSAGYVTHQSTTFSYTKTKLFFQRKTKRSYQFSEKRYHKPVLQRKCSSLHWSVTSRGRCNLMLLLPPPRSKCWLSGATHTNVSLMSFGIEREIDEAPETQHRCNGVARQRNQEAWGEGLRQRSGRSYCRLFWPQNLLSSHFNSHTQTLDECLIISGMN